MQGRKYVIIISSDCFKITADIISIAFNCLKNQDVLIGPATDKGYYLLAVKKLYRPLFKNISWSMVEVLTKTQLICEAHNLSVYLLPELNDIDTKGDLKKQENISSRMTISHD